MLWKPTQKVAFASRDAKVIIWYCSAKATVKDKAEVDANVGASCLVKAGEDKYNDCFVQMALKKVNEYRKTHLGAPLKFEDA
jgi:hypothetical protein